MISKRATAIASALVLTLAAAPLSSAFASDRHHGGYGRGGGHHGGGYGYGYGFNPVVGLATALVGAAVAIVTAPIALVAAVANARAVTGTECTCDSFHFKYVFPSA